MCGGCLALLDTHTLVHNRRLTRKIAVSAEGDGAFAVVDVDTLWRDGAGNDCHWLGRACKRYTLLAGGWEMIAHRGVAAPPPLPAQLSFALQPARPVAILGLVPQGRSAESGNDPAKTRPRRKWRRPGRW